MEVVAPLINCTDWFKDISDPTSRMVRISLNENPMYVDEKGNRNYEEPFYQTVIRVKETQAHNPEICIYDYFDSQTLEEAQRFIHQIARDIRFLGFQQIFLS
jgi:hypothetical protein